MFNGYPMSMLQIAFAMFAAGAGGGLLFTTLIALNKRYPRWFGSGHGLLGLSALAVLAYALSQSTSPISSATWWAAGVLGMAWCGGVMMFRVLRPKSRPLVLALMHGSLALAGIYLLYRVAF